MTTTRPQYVMNKSRQPYFLMDGSEVPGVTTIIRQLDKGALLNWAAKVEREAMEDETYRARIAASKFPYAGEKVPYAYTLVRDSAADIGTLAHAMIEAELQGMDFDLTGYPDDQVAKARAGMIRFMVWWNAEGFVLEDCEHRMVDEVRKVGGTADILARHPKKGRCLLDGKSSKAIYMEHKIQVAAYSDMLWREERAVVPRLPCIVRFGKGGGAFVPGRDTHWLTSAECVSGARMFDALLVLWRERKEFGE